MRKGRFAFELKNAGGFFSLLFLFVCSFLAGQNDIDSLKQKISVSSGADKSKYLLELALKYSPDDTAATFPILRESFKAALSVKYDRGIAQYFFSRARALSEIGSEKEGLSVLNECIKYVDTLKPNKLAVSYFITLGGMYMNAPDLTHASRVYLKALQMSDKINDTLGIARSCHGLGIVQQDAGNVAEAEKYELKAVKYYGMAGMKDKEAGMDSNLGSLFLSSAMKTKSESDYKKALDYINKGLQLAIKTKDYQLIGNCYNNLASLYGSKNDLDVCLQYNFMGLEIRKKNVFQYGTASSLGNIANVYQLKGRNDLAEKYVREAIDISKQIHANTLLVADYELLSDILSSQKKFESAFQYYKMSKNIHDSVNNADKIKSMSDLEKKYDSEKKDKEIELLNQTREVSDAQIARQKTLNYAIGIGLTLVVIFSFFLLRANGQKRKVNEQLHFQNNIIEEKNKDITDSINYAKRIQEAIQPAWEIKEQIFPDSFILLQPRDIVSGDFYWFTEKNGKRLIAAVDCTGHGVPGAFMSMIGNAFLNEIVNEKGVTEPGMILSELCHIVIKALKQTGASGEQRDGMDISLLSLSENNMAEWAGANNPLWIIRKGELIEFKPDKRPIGYFTGGELPFTNYKIELQENDILYIFTDGYADQFGGKKEGGKKFKVSRLKTLLLSIKDQPMNKQKEKLEQAMSDWRGELEQVDDICIIGIRI